MTEFSWGNVFNTAAKPFTVPFNMTKDALANSNTVAALRKQAQAWAARVVDLHRTPVPAQYKPQKTALLNRAKTIKSAVEKIFGTVPEFAAMNLGALPLIVAGVAVVGGTAALMTKWTFDYLTLKQNLNQYGKMVADGIAPDVAARMTTNNMVAARQNTITGNIAKIIPVVVIGGLLFAFKDKIFK